MAEYALLSPPVSIAEAKAPLRTAPGVFEEGSDAGANGQVEPPSLRERATERTLSLAADLSDMRDSVFRDLDRGAARKEAWRVTACLLARLFLDGPYKGETPMRTVPLAAVKRMGFPIRSPAPPVDPA